MKSLLKFFLFTPVILILLAHAACSGLSNVPGGGGPGGGGGGTGPYSIGGTVSGLGAGSSMTLQNNGIAQGLIVSANSAFTFQTAIVANQAYFVTGSPAP